MFYKVFLAVFICICILPSCKETNGDLLEKGIRLSAKKKYPEAIEKYTRVIKNNSKIELAYFKRGLCYINTKEYSRALHDFNTIINLKTRRDGNFIFELNPDIPVEEAAYQVSYEDGIFGRAQARFYLDSLKISYNDFQQLINSNYPEKVHCILFQAHILHQTGDDSTACLFAQRAKSMATRDVEMEDCNNSLSLFCQGKY